MELNKVDKKVEEIKSNNNIFSVGKVIKVNPYTVIVSGLNDITYYEEVNIADKAKGFVFAVGKNNITISLVEVNDKINPGDEVYSLKKQFKCLFSMDSMGKVIDIFGNDLIAGKRFDNLVEVPIENDPIPIMDRGLVEREFLTGITGIDMLYPIGRGQRQLIIGDKKTGKTQIALDAIVNQKDKNMVCIYVALGKTKKEVKDIYYELTKRGAASYTIIIASFNDELPNRTYLTPYVALSIAESMMMDSYDVLVVIDDLKKHADVYRQISLASKKTPGRDAYPSDIFYAHSKLLEKGCQHKNGGSITILPIVETKSSDITDYISTNIISICDGQLVLSSKNFTKGEKPALDYGLSVSRLGGNVQAPDMKKTGSLVRNKLLEYLEVRDIYELANIDEMSEELQNRLKEGKVILDKLGQYKFSPKSKEEMLDLYKFLEVGDNNENR
ncbi:MAG: F0F1 ATP synthase subunit alpha [Bacilli bacterium]|nr:F0F1 ATP synthase subunit alpha [Bacilli bacterium]MEE1370974.1 F0F1 ATP synthase subunit alpha [Bacilli bacterium]